MVAIAQAMPPQTLEELSALKVFSKHQIKRYGNLIVNTVTNWLEKPTKLHRPAVLRPCDAELERHEALRNYANHRGKEGIASNLVLPPAIYWRKLPGMTPPEHARAGKFDERLPAALRAFWQSDI